jgi:hypothetical protein
MFYSEQFFLRKRAFWLDVNSAYIPACDHQIVVGCFDRPNNSFVSVVFVVSLLSTINVCKLLSVKWRQQLEQQLREPESVHRQRRDEMDRNWSQRANRRCAEGRCCLIVRHGAIWRTELSCSLQMWTAITHYSYTNEEDYAEQKLIQHKVL